MVFVVEVEHVKLLDRVFPVSGHNSVLASQCLLPLVDVDGSGIVVDSFLSIWFGWFDGRMSELGRALSLSENGLRERMQLALCSSLGAILRDKLYFLESFFNFIMLEYLHLQRVISCKAR
jgi:hypothetical protein